MNQKEQVVMEAGFVRNFVFYKENSAMHTTRILEAICLVSLCITVQIGCTSDKTNSTEPGPLSAAGSGNFSQYPSSNTTGGATISAGSGGGSGIGTGTGGGPSLTIDASVTVSDGGGVRTTGTGGTTTPPVEPPRCGNGIVESGEDCESNVPISTTCQSLAQGTGTVGCDATCHFDINGCVATTSDANLFTVSYEISSAIGTVGIVTWSTTLTPVTEATIEFGLDTNYGMRAPVDLAQPQYRTLLLGMKGSHDYHFRVVAISGGTEYKSDDYVITTGPVTNLAQVLDITVDNPSIRSGGFIVTSLYQVAFIRTGGFAFIIDADGDIVWWYASSLSSATRARMSYDGKYMWMATEGMDAVNGIERVSMDGLDAQTFTTPITHDITAVSGDVMAYPAGGFNTCVVITEITPDGTMKPVYDTREIWGAGPCHANAIRYSETEGLYTLSDRMQGDIIMIDRATGRLVRRMKDYSFSWGTDQHGHHLLGDTILLYNNASRIVQEISFNDMTMQSSEIWRYGSSYNTEVLGDVQRLPNGNTLVTYSTAGRIHEVAPNSTRVAEIRFGGAVGYSVWRDSLYGPPPDVKL